MRFRCNRCSMPPRFFEWEDSPICPQCNASGIPHVAQLTDVHFVVMDPRGPIEGPAGRQLIACQPARAYLARGEMDMFSASDDPRAVTCPRCRGLPVWRERAMMFEEMHEVVAKLKSKGAVLVDKPRVEKGKAG